MSPKDRRLPLAEVEFVTPQKIVDGVHNVKHLRAGELLPQTDVRCPPMFLDPELRTVNIGDDLWFCDSGLIGRVRRAKAASKVAEAPKEK